MGKIRCKADGLAMAARDEVVAVPDGDVYAYTASANWEPVDKAATTAHNAGEEAEKASVAAREASRAPEDPEAEPEHAGADV